ncbi:MAG: alkaline phosphatase family protein [Planctomycetaceae bacterium]|nr:alkaline phosphatase family protein [Planctomycetaceae bacterium]
MWPPTIDVLAYIGPSVGFTVVGSFFLLLAAFGLLCLSILTWPFRLVSQLVRRFRHQIVGKVQRVVVVGLDGLDPGRTRRLMNEGRLPHLQKLADSGSFSDLRTTLPPISPVAWSSFMTGVNPGKHNIFDFLNRNLRTCLPELSSMKTSASVAGSWWKRILSPGGSIRPLRKSQPFWKILGEFGIHSTILRVPITFPPERFHGHLLAGMCLPDLRGTQGSFTLFTTSQKECRTSTGGIYVHVARTGNRIETYLNGPPNPSGSSPANLRIPLNITIDSQQNSATVAVNGRRCLLQPGKYSEWIPVTFRSGLFSRIHGICRMRIEQLTPEFRLYVSPLNIDPERPAFPIGYPFLFSNYLAKLHGAFATLGLAEDTWALNSGAISESSFLDQAYAIHDERERMFFDALARVRHGLCVCVFDASDRIQHMFYRHDNPSHPANAGKDARTHRSAIDQMYIRMDELVGRVQQQLDDRTALMVISDHGFCEFSRAVHLNAWLRETGYLVVDEAAEPGEYFAGVDWNRTRAYACGLSGIYINLAGRESRGIVAAGTEADELKREIAKRLQELTDGERGTRPFRRIYDNTEAYSGPYAGNGPDIIAGYNRGYRVSWETAIGRTDGSVFSDNTRHWSGDHCVDPELVPGVFFANREFALPETPAITDLAPTILNLLGVPVPPYMDGVPRQLAAEQEPAETRPAEPATVP